MPSSIVKSFADKTGKSIQQVEKLWDEAKASAKEQGHKEDYAYITGILKKMLKLDEETSSGDIAQVPSKIGGVVKRKGFDDYLDFVKSKKVIINTNENVQTKTTKLPSDILRQNNIKVKQVKPVADNMIEIYVYSKEDFAKADEILAKYKFDINYEIKQ